MVGALEQHVEESLDDADTNDDDEQGRLSFDEVDIVARPEEPLETVSEARPCRFLGIE